MYKVIGKRQTNFTPKDSDRSISGWNLYLVYNDPAIAGHGCDRIFVSDSKFVNSVVPDINDFVDIRYNRFGKVDSCDVRKSAE